MNDDQSKLARWSKRKLEPDSKVSPLEVEHDEEPEVPDDLAELDVASLDKSFDFSRFLQDDVPTFLKQMALRRFWQLNASLVERDGLNDYDEDFSDTAMKIDEMKGFFERHIIEAGAKSIDEGLLPSIKHSGHEQDVSSEKDTTRTLESQLSETQITSLETQTEPLHTIIAKDTEADSDAINNDKDEVQLNRKDVLKAHGWWS